MGEEINSRVPTVERACMQTIRIQRYSLKDSVGNLTITTRDSTSTRTTLSCSAISLSLVDIVFFSFLFLLDLVRVFMQTASLTTLVGTRRTLALFRGDGNANSSWLPSLSLSISRLQTVYINVKSLFFFFSCFCIRFSVFNVYFIISGYSWTLT